MELILGGLSRWNKDLFILLTDFLIIFMSRWLNAIRGGATLALQLSDVHRDSDWFQWTEEEDAERVGRERFSFRWEGRMERTRLCAGRGRAPGTFHRLQISSNYDENQEQLQFPIKYWLSQAQAQRTSSSSSSSFVVDVPVSTRPTSSASLQFV